MQLEYRLSAVLQLPVWFYTNDFIPALCILCMYRPIWFYMDFIHHGYYMDLIHHGQYGLCTSPDAYLFCVVFNCVFYCFINMSVFVSNDEMNIFNQSIHSRLKPGFNILHKNNCRSRRETFKCWDSVRPILEILRYVKTRPWYWLSQVIVDAVWGSSSDYLAPNSSDKLMGFFVIPPLHRGCDLCVSLVQQHWPGCHWRHNRGRKVALVVQGWHRGRSDFAMDAMVAVKFWACSKQSRQSRRRGRSLTGRLKETGRMHTPSVISMRHRRGRRMDAQGFAIGRPVKMRTVVNIVYQFRRFFCLSYTTIHMPPLADQ